MTVERTDIAIVGGGIIGLSVAFELLGRGLRPVVIEKMRPGSGASAVSGGMLAPASEALLEHPRLIRFGRDSLNRFPDFVGRVERISRMSCRYRAEGTLWVALHRDHRVELERLLAVQRELELPVEWLDAAAVVAREPYVSSRAVAGLLAGGDHQVEPRALVASLDTAVRALGARVLENHDVKRVEPEARAGGGGWIVSGARKLPAGGSAEFELRAGRVVMAAGAWTSGRIESPVAPLNVRPVKGQVVRLTGEDLIRHTIFTPDVYLVPRVGGELLVGGTVEEQGFDDVPTAGGVRELLRRAWEVLPGIDELHVAEVAASFRPAVRDHMPVIGHAGCDDLFVATAHYRNGILLAPATGFYLAELIASGAVPEALEAFTMERFAPA